MNDYNLHRVMFDESELPRGAIQMEDGDILTDDGVVIRIRAISNFFSVRINGKLVASPNTKLAAMAAAKVEAGRASMEVPARTYIRSVLSKMGSVVRK